METYNLLVIDDDPNIRKLLGELLAGRPEFHLLIAGDGKEAVRQFAENRIDMVLTDIHMPGFTGLELMADMKKINFKPEILVMTANATPENVETARKLGARSVILKPFDDLEVIEAEINKALRAVKAARPRTNGDGNGHGLPPPVAAAAHAQAMPESPAHEAPARPAPQAAHAPPAKPAPWSAPKQNLWPARKPAAPAPVPVAPPEKMTATTPAAAAASSGARDLPDFDTWRTDLTGNETPPAPSPRSPAAPVPPRTEAAAEAPPPVRTAPPARPPTPAPRPAPPAAAAPPQATRPAAAPSPEPHHAPPAAGAPAHHETVRPAAPAGHPGPVHAAVHETKEEEIPEMPSDLEAIFRMATSFDTGRMRMQVPIVCLQTWEERGAIAALRRLAGELHREFCVWSAARGLVKEGGQAMGETYRDAGRALEFIRRQKNNGVYVLADFRPCLDDKTVVRVLREMVMDLETSRLMLVLTAPRLPAPPELAQACVTFDWPAVGGSDLKGLYEEVAAEVAASTGRVVRLDPQSRDLLLERVKEMPAGRARFEIARHLMTVSQQS